jgi:hypothetical protein
LCPSVNPRNGIRNVVKQKIYVVYDGDKPVETRWDKNEAHRVAYNLSDFTMNEVRVVAHYLGDPVVS